MSHNDVHNFPTQGLHILSVPRMTFSKWVVWGTPQDGQMMLMLIVVIKLVKISDQQVCVCGEFDWQTWGQVSENMFLQQKINSILGGEASGCELDGHPEGHKTLFAFAQGELSDKNRGVEDVDKNKHAS